MKSTSAVLLGCACTVLFGCSTTVITVDGDAARDASTTADAAVPLDAHEPQEDTGPPIDNTLATYCRTLIPATENDYLPIGACLVLRADARAFCSADVRCGLAEYVQAGQGLSCSQLHRSNGLRQWVCVPVSAVPDGLRLIGS